jgi:hypothetical protein
MPRASCSFRPGERHAQQGQEPLPLFIILGAGHETHLKTARLVDAIEIDLGNAICSGRPIV